MYILHWQFWLTTGYQWKFLNNIFLCPSTIWQNLDPEISNTLPAPVGPLNQTLSMDFKNNC
jgi:hypothetical protein